MLVQTDSAELPDTAPGYAAEVLADSPVAYWRLSETSGSTVADETGNGHDGTVYGANLDAHYDAAGVT